LSNFFEKNEKIFYPPKMAFFIKKYANTEKTSTILRFLTPLKLQFSYALPEDYGKLEGDPILGIEWEFSEKTYPLKIDNLVKKI
jgi:hypothetical protein